jgi:hypothetical protein
MENATVTAQHQEEAKILDFDVYLVEADEAKIPN